VGKNTGENRGEDVGNSVGENVEGKSGNNAGTLSGISRENLTEYEASLPSCDGILAIASSTLNRTSTVESVASRFLDFVE